MHLSQTPTIPFQMRAVVMHERGGPAVLQYESLPTPRPLRDEVLVRVESATVNHTDIFHRSGQFFIQKALPHVLGMDVAGTIAAVGPQVRRFVGGERVMATFEGLGRERDGAYAEYTLVPESELHPLPDSVDTKTAASIGLAFTTAWLALIEHGHLAAGDRLLVHAAASGVGTSAVQIGRWAGAQVMAVARPDKADRLSKLGAHMVLPPDTPNLVRMVNDATDGRGATHVLELVGHGTLGASVASLGDRGTILCVGTLGGDQAELNVMDLMMRRGSIHGIYGKLPAAAFDTILDLFGQGVFHPVIDRVMPLRQARQAHELVEGREVFGKIVLDPWLR